MLYFLLFPSFPFLIKWFLCVSGQNHIALWFEDGEQQERAGAGERLVLEGEAGVAQLSDGDAETREVGAGTQGVPATGGELVMP